MNEPLPEKDLLALSTGCCLNKAGLTPSSYFWRRDC